MCCSRVECCHSQASLDGVSVSSAWCRRLSLQCGSPKAWLLAEVRRVENLFDVQRSLVSRCSSLSTTRRIELIYDGTRVTPKSLESRH